MQSPFFFRHLAVLALAALNCGMAAVWLRRSAQGAGPATLWKVLGRASAILYAMASTLLLLVVALLFFILEVADEGRAVWQVSERWPEVRPGMTAPEVRQRLGPPRTEQPSDLRDGEEVWTYQLHPLGDLDEGYLVFAGALPVLTEKLPPDDVWAAFRTSVVPEGYTRERYLRTTGEITLLISFGGLILLALVSVLPFRARGRWQSWTLYTPLMALFLATLYELNASQGWRFDFFLLGPLYAAILLAWIIRLAAVRFTKPASGR